MDQLPQNILENILSSLGPQAASRFGATSREARHAFQQTGIATAASLDASEKLQKAVRARQRKPFIHYEKLQSLSGPGNPPPGPGLPNMLFPNHYHDPRKFVLTRALRNSIGGERMTAMMGQGTWYQDYESPLQWEIEPQTGAWAQSHQDKYTIRNQLGHNWA